MKNFDRTKIFRRKNDIIALDYDGARHYFPIEFIEFGFSEHIFNAGAVIAPATLVGPELVPDIVPKYHNVLVDMIIAVRPDKVPVALVGPPAVNIVVDKSCKIFLHEPQAQPRRFTPFGNLEASIGDHQSSPYDDPDESIARLYLMHNDEPAFLANNDSGTNDPPAASILQVIRMYWAQYVLGEELKEKPATYTPIPYERTTLVKFAARSRPTSGGGVP